MAQKEYQLLQQDETSQLSSPFPIKPKRSPFLLPILTTVLILSLSTNILQLIRSNLSTSPPLLTAPVSDVSRYAKVARTVPRQFQQDPIYTSHNRAIANEVWEEVTLDLGIVALSDSFAEEHDLMPAQRFPWDASKGIYLINVWHQLHCLVSLPSTPAPSLADARVKYPVTTYRH